MSSWKFARLLLKLSLLPFDFQKLNELSLTLFHTTRSYSRMGGGGGGKMSDGGRFATNLLVVPNSLKYVKKELYLCS